MPPSEATRGLDDLALSVYLDRLFRGRRVLWLGDAASGGPDRAARVAAARERQSARFQALSVPEILTNAACPPSLLDEVASADAGALALLRDAAEKMRLSARAYHRVLKVARTIADLDAVPRVGRIHLAEALSFRVYGQQGRSAQAA